MAIVLDWLLSPTVSQDYVHRIGRTGRAGARGIATTFFHPAVDGRHAQVRRCDACRVFHRVPCMLRTASRMLTHFSSRMLALQGLVRVLRAAHQDVPKLLVTLATQGKRRKQSATGPRSQSSATHADADAASLPACVAWARAAPLADAAVCSH